MWPAPLHSLLLVPHNRLPRPHPLCGAPSSMLISRINNIYKVSIRSVKQHNYSLWLLYAPYLFLSLYAQPHISSAFLTPVGRLFCTLYRHLRGSLAFFSMLSDNIQFLPLEVPFLCPSASKIYVSEMEPVPWLFSLWALKQIVLGLLGSLI